MLRVHSSKQWNENYYNEISCCKGEVAIFMSQNWKPHTSVTVHITTILSGVNLWGNKKKKWYVYRKMSLCPFYLKNMFTAYL